MKGKDIKDVLLKKGIAQTDIARVLGISPNNLNNMLAKDDVRTGLLESIASAANIPISVFYGDSYSITGNNIVNSGDNNAVNASDDRLITLLVNKDEQLTMAMRQTEKSQGQIDRLLNIIESR